MLQNLLRRHSRVIKEFSIRKFRRVEDSIELVLIIIFIDDSVLYVRDYVFNEREHKYSYHWHKKNFLSGNFVWLRGSASQTYVSPNQSQRL